MESALKRNLLTGIVLVGIVGLLAVFATPQYRQGEASPAGHAAKDFAFQIDGKPAHLSDLRGKVVVLNFWATWCPPCVDETPSLNRLQEWIAPKGGLVLGISQDEDAAAYSNFLSQYGVQFPTSRDASRGIANSYGTLMYPETYVIDKQGRIARKIVGAQDWDSPDMQAYLQSLLTEKD